MKKTRLLFALPVMAAFFIVGCQRSSQQDIISVNEIMQPKAVSAQVAAKQKPNTGACNPYAYTIRLESKTFVNSNWEWIWSVQNPNPGNGSNGTSQNLSHWGMQFGACFAWSSVIGAAYSDDGSSWNSFNPTFQTDPSQGCMTTPVLKFDYGTDASNKTYYKLIVSQNYDVMMVPGYYKSGANTGCCTFLFEGVGCITDDPSGPR